MRLCGCYQVFPLDANDDFTSSQLDTQLTAPSLTITAAALLWPVMSHMSHMSHSHVTRVMLTTHLRAGSWSWSPPATGQS